MAPTILYTTCLIGALGLFLLIRVGGSSRRRDRAWQAAGAILGLGALAYLVVAAADVVGSSVGSGGAGGAGGSGGSSSRPETFFVLFSIIAIASAVRMITHHRPVYSALYFVLVVLASAGLFLLLEAEFMAFALIIVYAGAILITYMFVLMLAQQGPRSDDIRGQPEYDLNPRDPLAGAVVGFILLALLSRTALEGTAQLPPPDLNRARVEMWQELERMPARLEDVVASIEGEAPFVLGWAGRSESLVISADGREASVHYTMMDGTPKTYPLPRSARPENVQSVGLALIAPGVDGAGPRFPISLELAGVILLMAMFGAVILARRQIELTEDEKREAGGMRRLGHHDDPAEGTAS